MGGVGKAVGSIVDPVGSAIYGGGAPNIMHASGKGQQPPAAPNYQGAAQQQQTSGMINQNTPFGSQTFSQDPNSPSGFQSNINLNPQAQSALNSQLQLSSGMGQLANSQLGQVQQDYSKPFDMSSVGQIADQSYGAQTSRLDPQWQQREEMQKTQLANQGLAPGGQAYDAAMRDFNQGRNDAYQQARLASIQTMPQTYQLASAAREQPLNELNAIRSGAQVQNPQFQQFQGAPYFGAAQAQGNYQGDIYNAQMGQQNALMGGLFGLGGTLGAAALLA